MDELPKLDNRVSAWNSEIKQTDTEQVLSTAELSPIVTSSRSVCKSAYQISAYIFRYAGDLFKLYGDKGDLQRYKIILWCIDTRIETRELNKEPKQCYW